MKIPCLLALYLLFAASLGGAESLVVLDSGEQVVGEMISKPDADVLILQSKLLGLVKLPSKRVLTVEKQPDPEPSRPAEIIEKAPVSKKIPEIEVADNSWIERNLAALIEEREIVETVKNFKAPATWSGNLRLGVNLSKGDRRWVETFSRGKLEVRPKQSPNFFRYTGSYTYRETERSNGSEVKSTDKYDLGFIYRRSLFDNWFLQNSLSGRVDQVKGIDREIQETIGLGYNFKPSARFELIFGGGGGVEDFESAKEDTRMGLNPVMNVFQEATWRPLERTSFVQRFNYNWNPENEEQYSFVLRAAVRIRLTDLLGLEFSFNKSFDNDVGDGSSRDDAQWRNALVVYF